jgi:hypothetical protein
MNTQVKLEVKKFCKSFIIIVVCIYLADLVVGESLKWLYSHQTSGFQCRTSFAINTTKADYLVFGSSRASHHYDPRVFEQKLNASFYNCGRDAQGIFYSCAVASAIINRYKPKCIIIDIRPGEFTTSDEGKLATLFPYQNNLTIKKVFKYNGGFENVKLLSHIYPYNSIFTSLLLGVTSFNKKRAVDDNGYIKLKGTLTDSVTNLKESDQVDTNKVKELTNLLSKLDKLNIPALLVISPLHYNYSRNSATAKLCAQICSKFKSTKFVYFGDNLLCKQGKYFMDTWHLNAAGAKLFSEEMVDQILSVIN